MHVTAFRLISLPVHAALELAVGLAVLVASVGLGLSPAGLVVGVAVGAVLVGLALQAAVAELDRIDVAAHSASDLGLAIALAGAAVVLTVSGDPTAGVLFTAAAMAQVGLNATTRYSGR